MGSGVIGCRSFTFVSIHTGHKVGLQVLGQFLHDVNRLSVLSLGVDNFHGLVLRNEYTLVTDLSTHLTIEWCVVEYQFIESALLLGDLTVAQDVAFVFAIVVAHELLFASLQFHPVAIFNGSSIAGAFFLLLHLYVEAVLIDGEAIFAADEFRQVEGESIGVEEFEGIGTSQFCLSLSLQGCHTVVEHADTAVEGAEEGIFLFLDDAGDELTLCWQFGIGFSHFSNQSRNEFVNEGFLLIQESIGKTNGTTEYTANDITCLGIAGQLSVCDRESNGTDVVGNHAHGHINIILQCLLAAIVFLACKAFHFLNERLEYVSVVIGMFTLQHAYEALESHTRINDVHGKFL